MEPPPPRFAGINPTAWISRLQRYFDFYNTPETRRLRIASYYLDGIALTWYENRFISGWKEFLVALEIRFGTDQCTKGDDVIKKTSHLLLDRFAKKVSSKSTTFEDDISTAEDKHLGETDMVDFQVDDLFMGSNEDLRCSDQFLATKISPSPDCLAQRMTHNTLEFDQDENGRRYLDAVAGVVTVSCGHCHTYSPLMRLLDPLLKKQDSQSNDFIQQPTGTIATRGTCQHWKSEGLSSHGLMQLSLKNGLHFFTVVVDNSSSGMLAVVVRNLPSVGQSDHSRISERKSKSAFNLEAFNNEFYSLDLASFRNVYHGRLLQYWFAGTGCLWKKFLARSCQPRHTYLVASSATP